MSDYIYYVNYWLCRYDTVTISPTQTDTDGPNIAVATSTDQLLDSDTTDSEPKRVSLSVIFIFSVLG